MAGVLEGVCWEAVESGGVEQREPRGSRRKAMQEGRATGALGGRQGLAAPLWDKRIKELRWWTSGLWRKASWVPKKKAVRELRDSLFSRSLDR